AAAVLPRASDLGLGGEVRPCRGGDELRGDSAVAAQRHLLFGPPARAQVRGGEPRQPVLLRDLGVPSGLPRGERFAAVGGKRRAAAAQRRAVGAVLRAVEERLEDQELSSSHFARLTMLNGG